MTIYKARYETPLGGMVGAFEGDAAVGLWFSGEQRFLPADLDTWEERPDERLSRQMGAWLAAYFDKKEPEIDFPLEPRGSDFRQAVWTILCEIPYGATLTYGEIARRIGAEQGRSRPPAAQAVGGAVGHNPISILIPCHRVVGSDGSLTGYGGGLHRKIALLELEGVR